MLTGEFPITSGTAIIDGFDVSTNLKDVCLDLDLRDLCANVTTYTLIVLGATKDRLLPSGK